MLIKERKKLNSLPLSHVVILMRRYRENRYLQVLRNTAELNSYLGLFALCQKFVFGFFDFLVFWSTLKAMLICIFSREVEVIVYIFW